MCKYKMSNKTKDRLFFAATPSTTTTAAAATAKYHDKDDDDDERSRCKQHPHQNIPSNFLFIFVEPVD